VGAAYCDDYAVLGSIITGSLAFDMCNLSQVGLGLNCLVNYENGAFRVLAYTVAYASKQEFLDATHSTASHNY